MSRRSHRTILDYITTPPAAFGDQLILARRVRYIPKMVTSGHRFQPEMSLFDTSGFARRNRTEGDPQ